MRISYWSSDGCSSDLPDTDQLTLGNLGIRCFNSLAACLKLALSGYYQAATLHIRDLLEVAFLLDHFSTNPALVTEWRTLPERDRERKFSALAIRQALDRSEEHTSELQSLMRISYAVFCLKKKKNK